MKGYKKVPIDFFIYFFTQVLSTDVCVPISKLPEVITKVKENIQKSSLQGTLLITGEIMEMLLVTDHVWNT